MLAASCVSSFGQYVPAGVRRRFTVGPWCWPHWPRRRSMEGSGRSDRDTHIELGATAAGVFVYLAVAAAWVFVAITGVKA